MTTIADEDAVHLHLVRDVPVRPVFIIGLHRTGRTLLYECLSRIYPLAYLSAYHIIFYRRLLSGHLDGTAASDRHSLDEYFDRCGLQTRIVDDVQLTHETPEEYGWLLKRNAPSLRRGPRTAPLLAETCRKLTYLADAPAAVLLKSPWDTARCALVSTLFPDARFVFIARVRWRP